MTKEALESSCFSTTPFGAKQKIIRDKNDEIIRFHLSHIERMLFVRHFFSLFYILGDFAWNIRCRTVDDVSMGCISNRYVCAWSLRVVKRNFFLLLFLLTQQKEKTTPPQPRFSLFRCQSKDPRTRKIIGEYNTNLICVKNISLSTTLIQKLCSQRMMNMTKHECQ